MRFRVPSGRTVVTCLFVLLLMLSPALAGVEAPPEIPDNPGVPGLLAEIAELQAQIATLEAQIAAMSARIAELEADVAARDARVAELEADVAAKETRIAELEEDVAAMTARIAAKDAQIAGLEADVAARDDRITELETEVAEKDVLIADLGARVEFLESHVPVVQSGQDWCQDIGGLDMACAGTGQDGDWQAGTAWDLPRFTDNGDGTVTDNFTGLTWLRDMGCPELGPAGESTGNWQEALDAVRVLAEGQCGLIDGSAPGDWRLPNIKELQSLMDYGESFPSLPSDEPFINSTWERTKNWWWSSSTRAGHGYYAWAVAFYDDGGETYAFDKETSEKSPAWAIPQFPDIRIWAVRGGVYGSD